MATPWPVSKDPQRWHPHRRHARRRPAAPHLLTRGSHRTRPSWQGSSTSKALSRAPEHCGLIGDPAQGRRRRPSRSVVVLGWQQGGDEQDEHGDDRCRREQDGGLLDLREPAGEPRVVASVNGPAHTFRMRPTIGGHLCRRRQRRRRHRKHRRPDRFNPRAGRGAHGPRSRCDSASTARLPPTLRPSAPGSRLGAWRRPAPPRRPG